jgi:hypothetical protein
VTVCSRCGREFANNGSRVRHEARCFTPRTLERYLELLEITRMPAPEHVSHLGECWMPSRSVEAEERKPHRMVYVLVHDEIPQDKPQVLHHCDNNPCVNPDHLYAGTRFDNMHDMWERKRHLPPQEYWTEASMEGMREKLTGRTRDPEVRKRQGETMKRAHAANPGHAAQAVPLAVAGRRAKLASKLRLCRDCRTTGSVETGEFEWLPYGSGGGLRCHNCDSTRVVPVRRV